MNGTMLSQIIWVMFLAHHCLPKIAKNCHKKPKVYFRINYYTGSDDFGSYDTGTVSLTVSRRPAAIKAYKGKTVFQSSYILVGIAPI